MATPSQRPSSVPPPDVTQLLLAWHGGNELRRMGVAARAAVPELMTLAESQHGPTAKFLRDFAFQIDRAAALSRNCNLVRRGARYPPSG